MDETKENTNEADLRLVKAKSDALRLLSFKPRSVEEMRERLRLKRYGPAVIDSVIESLKRQGLLDDAKFAKLFAHSRIYTRPSGRRQLEFDLKKKGLSRDLITATLETFRDTDERQMARDLVLTRFRKMTGVQAGKKKARLFGFLKRRGFGNGIIFSVLNELFAGEMGDD